MTWHHLKTSAVAVMLTAIAATPASAQPDPSATGDGVRPSAHQRFKDYVEATVGPLALLETIAWAGVSQRVDTPTEWGRDAQAFGRRYASILGQGVVQESVAYGLSEAMAVDSRFHLSHKRGILPRAGDTMLQSMTSRRLDGSRVVSAPLLAGYTAGGLGMMAWYPHGYTYKDGLRCGGVALASRAGINLLREFVVRR